MSRIIEVVDYDPAWPEQFLQEKLKLSTVLESVAVSIMHIGSTSIAGMCAKPIIDILLEVSCLSGLDSLNDALADMGYKAKGENGIAGRRYFQKGGKQRSHHMHAFVTGDKRIRQHLLFRDFLIAHPERAAEYAAIKREAARLCQNDSAVYQKLKHNFITVHLELAQNC